MSRPASWSAKYRVVVWPVFVGLALVAFAGCGEVANDGEVESASHSTARTVSLRVSGAEAYDATLAQHRGKVVLVDFWATWCAPCVEQFPHTVAMARKYEKHGLAVIGVSLNVPTEAEQVQKFLASHDARFENLLSSYDSGVRAIEAFGLPGPIPCYRVYDRLGELHREFTVDPRAERQFTVEDIEAAVRQLL